MNRNPKHRLGATRDAAELKEHPFFASVDWISLGLKQVTPPFKPVVESDESTNNFDPEFTGADISDFVDMSDEELVDEEDPSESWVSQSFSQSSLPHTPNGPLGSERLSLSRSGSNSSLSARLGASLGFSSFTPTLPSNPKDKESGKSTPRVGGTPGSSPGESARSAAVEIKAKKKKNDVHRGSPLTNSVQENFRGFSYSGGESVMPGEVEGMSNGRETEDLDVGMLTDEPGSYGSKPGIGNSTSGRYADQRRNGGSDIMSY